MTRIGLIFILPILLTASVEIKSRTDYTGHQLITARIETKEQLKELQQLYTKGEYDFWTDPHLSSQVDILVSPEKNSQLKDYFRGLNIAYESKIDDIQVLVDAEQSRIKANQLSRQNGITWDSYYSYDEIIQWANSILTVCPGLITNETIGLSTEGRELLLYKLSTGGATNKPAIWIDGTFHAREWISPATVTYALNELCVNNATYMEFLNAVDFYIVPFVNPDGYQYSRDVTRMWRKTRQDHNSTMGCIGVDPNRNFEFQFGGAGTSTDKCSDIYTGPEPFSEPEARAVRDYLLNPTINWQVYITVHSYGQYVLIPFSYAEDAYPSDFNDMLMFAQNMSSAMTSVHATPFTVGQSAITLGATAGCADDWAKEIAGIKYAYTFEVRDTGKYGFLLPPEEILPTAQETMKAFIYTGRNLAGLPDTETKP